MILHKALFLKSARFPKIRVGVLDSLEFTLVELLLEDVPLQLLLIGWVFSDHYLIRGRVQPRGGSDRIPQRVVQLALSLYALSDFRLGPELFSIAARSRWYLTNES